MESESLSDSLVDRVIKQFHQPEDCTVRVSHACKKCSSAFWQVTAASQPFFSFRVREVQMTVNLRHIWQYPLNTVFILCFMRQLQTWKKKLLSTYLFCRWQQGGTQLPARKSYQLTEGESTLRLLCILLCCFSLNCGTAAILGAEQHPVAAWSFPLQSEPFLYCNQYCTIRYHYYHALSVNWSIQLR